MQFKFIAHNNDDVLDAVIVSTYCFYPQFAVHCDYFINLCANNGAVRSRETVHLGRSCSW